MPKMKLTGGLEPKDSEAGTDSDQIVCPAADELQDGENIFPLQNLPEIVMRKILKMLPKTIRDNLRLTCRWFEESVVKLDATYRHLKIRVWDPCKIKGILTQMKMKGSYMQNTLRICFVLKCQPFDESSTSEILNEWKDYVYGLDITNTFGSKIISNTNQMSSFSNLEYLQIQVSSQADCSKGVEELINKHVETLKTLHIFNKYLNPELQLQCRKFTVLQELKVSGISMSSMISLLGFCCETLVHLDVLMDSECSESQVNDLDCHFPRLRYLSLREVIKYLPIRGVMNTLQYLQVQVSSPADSSKIVEELITKNADTLKTLHISYDCLHPEFQLQCKKFTVLQELKVSTISMSSMISLLGFCCETLVHLDVSMNRVSSESQLNDLDCHFPRLRYLSLRGGKNSLYVIILRLCANQLVGLNIDERVNRYYLGGLEMPNLKFLYYSSLFNSFSMPNSCPKLEFLKMNSTSNIQDSSRPKLTNLKALIVSKYPENENGWISNAIKSSRDNLEFIHVNGIRTRSEVLQTKERIEAIVPERVKVLLPDKSRQICQAHKTWLIQYVKRNPIYNRMLKLPMDEGEGESFETFNFFMEAVDSDYSDSEVDSELWDSDTNSESGSSFLDSGDFDTDDLDTDSNLDSDDGNSSDSNLDSDEGNSSDSDSSSWETCTDSDSD